MRTASAISTGSPTSIRSAERTAFFTGSTKHPLAEWGKTAHAYADGLQNSASRRKLILSALGKSIDRLGEDRDAFYAQANWKPETGDSYEIHLGMSRPREFLEIQLRKQGKFAFGFRTDPKTSAILPPMAEQIIAFNSRGALPVPRASIIRNVGDGSFSYNFNLSFAPTFEKFAEEGTSLLKNPDLGTNKGREVFVNYLLSQKAIWLGPAKSIKGGTSYPIFSIDPDDPKPSIVEIGVDLSGDLNSCRFGSLTVPTIIRGDQDILEKLPDWPDLPTREEQSFDLALMMDVISQLTKLSSAQD